MKVKVVEYGLWINLRACAGQLICSGGILEMPIDYAIAQRADCKSVHGQIGASIRKMQANRKVAGHTACSFSGVSHNCVEPGG